LKVCSLIGMGYEVACLGMECQFLGPLVVRRTVIVELEPLALNSAHIS